MMIFETLGLHPFTKEAFEFAQQEHEGQKRKYTNDPYIIHPVSVCRRVMKAIFDNMDLSPTDAESAEIRSILEAALLHDTVEDCGTSLTTIEKKFGCRTAELVFWLSDILQHSQGNRSTRKHLSAVRLAAAPVSARLIKLCDLEDNTESIVHHDAAFSVLYLKEKTDIVSGFSYAYFGLFHNVEKAYNEMLAQEQMLIQDRLEFAMLRGA